MNRKISKNCTKMIFVLLGLLLFVQPSSAANVDLLTNISPSSSVYSATDEMTFVVEVYSRGEEDTTGPSQITIQVPNALNSLEPWNDTVVCVSENNAVCPTGFTLVGDTITGDIPSLPAAGKVTFTVVVTGVAANNINGDVAVTAIVANNAADTETNIVTNTGFVIISVIPPEIVWDIEITGPTTSPAPGGTQETYQIILSNTGRDDAGAVFAQIGPQGFTSSRGSGTFAIGAPYVEGTTYRSISCVATTGTADCADAIGYKAYRDLNDNLIRETIPFIGASAPLIDCSLPADQSRPFFCTRFSNLWTTGVASFSDRVPQLPNRFGLTVLPAGSSVTFELVVDIGVSKCSVGADADRQLNASVRIFSVSLDPTIGSQETDGSNSDNASLLLTAIGADMCLQGDLEMLSFTQSAATPSPFGPGSPWEYKIVYTNTGGTAVDARIDFNMAWNYYSLDGNIRSTATYDADPVCLAAGGAVCPTSWTISGTNASALVPSMPDGSTITVTYSGTTGVDITDNFCNPSTFYPTARIYPPAPFFDTNYDPSYGARHTYGNNGNRVLSTANIGTDCNITHNAIAELSGPYSDTAATTLAILPLAPGDTVYFKSSMVNEDETAAVDFNRTWNMNFTSTINGQRLGPEFLLDFIPSDPSGRYYISQEPGDAVGLPTTRSDGYPSNIIFDSGVTCLASGATCMPQLSPFNSRNQSGTPNAYVDSGWAYYTSAAFPRLDNSGNPIPFETFPNQGKLDFITTFRVPELNPAIAAAGCFGATDTTYNRKARFTVGASTSPFTPSRNGGDNIAQVNYSIMTPACTATLAVSKIAVTTELPADRIAIYDIVVENTSAINLDLPHLVDVPEILPAGTVTSINCTATTGGGVCPAFALVAGTKYLADGTNRPIDLFDQLNGLTPIYDFVWGTPGAATMPAGSTVSFQVSITYPAGLLPSPNNIAIFNGDPSTASGALWPTVSDDAQVTVPIGAALGVVKTANRLQAFVGEEVTYTVDLYNFTGNDLTDAHFIDDLDPLLFASNPTGFGNYTCESIDDTMTVFPSTISVVPLPCPTPTMTPTGITFTIPNLFSFSGLRLTYTVVVPATPTSILNIASLVQSLLVSTEGDASGQVSVAALSLVDIDGTIWNDEDRSATGTFFGIQNDIETGNDAGGLTTVLVDDAGIVIASIPVNADGTYRFTGIEPAQIVTLYITATNAAPGIGDMETAPVLPDNWIGSSPLSTDLYIQVVNLSEIDFGIDELPLAANDNAIIEPNLPTKVDVLANDDQGDAVVSTTVSITGGTDTDGDVVGTLDQLSVLAEGKWNVDPTTGEITFTAEAGFERSPTPITYEVMDAGGNVTTAIVSLCDRRTGECPIDSDMDGISDNVECNGDVANCVDTDEDGIPDHLDIDDDNDGIPTAQELIQDRSTDNDQDGDGISSHLDQDSDGDGILDINEGHAGTTALSGTDTDNDGLDDAFDADNGGTSAATPDTDGSIPDYLDADSDGDGIPDLIEGHVTGANSPSGTDTDGDGIDDAFDSDNGGTPAATPDTDTDGTPDYRDLDSDNDNVPDIIEGGDALTSTASGTDTDGDGIDDAFDADNGGTAPTIPDTDGDATPNFRDADDDGDGIDTINEDANGDGDPRNDDSNGDGIPDYLSKNESSNIILSGGPGCASAGNIHSSSWLVLLGLMIGIRRKRRRL